MTMLPSIVTPSTRTRLGFCFQASAIPATRSPNQIPWVSPRTASRTRETLLEDEPCRASGKHPRTHMGRELPSLNGIHLMQNPDYRFGRR